MNKRIKYMKSEDGSMVSRRVFQTNHGEMQVRYYPDSFLVLIFRAGDGEVINTFTCKNNHDLKAQIKEELIAMGAQFAEETRIHE